MANSHDGSCGFWQAGVTDFLNKWIRKNQGPYQVQGLTWDEIEKEMGEVLGDPKGKECRKKGMVLQGLCAGMAYWVKREADLLQHIKDLEGIVDQQRILTEKSVLAVEVADLKARDAARTEESCEAIRRERDELLGRVGDLEEELYHCKHGGNGLRDPKPSAPLMELKETPPPPYPEKTLYPPLPVDVVSRRSTVTAPAREATREELQEAGIVAPVAGWGDHAPQVVEQAEIRPLSLKDREAVLGRLGKVPRNDWDQFVLWLVEVGREMEGLTREDQVILWRSLLGRGTLGIDVAGVAHPFLIPGQVAKHLFGVYSRTAGMNKMKRIPGETGRDTLNRIQAWARCWVDPLDGPWVLPQAGAPGPGGGMEQGRGVELLEKWLELSNPQFVGHLRLQHPELAPNQLPQFLEQADVWRQMHQGEEPVHAITAGDQYKVERSGSAWRGGGRGRVRGFGGLVRDERAAIEQQIQRLQAKLTTHDLTRSGGKWSRRPRDWDCLKCQTHNFAWRQECVRCQDPRSPHEPVGGTEVGAAT